MKKYNSNAIIRKIYNTTDNSLKIRGSVSTGGIPQQMDASQDLSINSLNYTTSVTENFKVNGVYFIFNSPATQVLSLEYNRVVIDSREIINAETAYFDLNGFKVFGSLGNELTIKCTNTETPNITVSVIIDIEVT